MNSASSNGRDVLLSEVRELKKAVASLEAKLADQDDGQGDVWAIWPYCWVVTGWDRAADMMRGVGERIAWRRSSRGCRSSRRRFQDRVQGCRDTGRGIITIKPV